MESNTALHYCTHPRTRRISCAATKKKQQQQQQQQRVRTSAFNNSFTALLLGQPTTTIRRPRLLLSRTRTATKSLTMRLYTILFLLLAAAALVSAQWDKDDYEIFELQAALEKDEGEGANFYTFFNLTKGATAAEVRKAYRARSMELHPDKHQSSATAARRFERLGVINKILRDHRRDRYDHFLTNGFPKWRGTGYYYARYRPGLVSVLVFLILVTAAIELLIRNITYRRDRKRLDTLIVTAKVLAWGPRFRSIEAGLANDDPTHNKNIIVPGEKKVRVPLGAGIDVPPLAKRKPDEEEGAYWDNDEKVVRKAISAGITASGDTGRRQIDALVTREAEVLIMDPVSKEWTLLDDSAAPKPRFTQTWPFALVQAVTGKVAGQRTDAAQTDASTSNGVANGEAMPSSSKKRKNKKKQQ